MKVIVVNGPARSGKDTFIRYAIEYAGAHHIITESISIVDKVKEIARHCGWNGGKTDEDRKFLSDLKDLLSDYNDLPYKSVSLSIEGFKTYAEHLGLNTQDILYFVIAREPEDISRFVCDFNATSIFIDRGWPNPLHGNHADDNVFDYAYDYTIMNDGTLDDLKASAQAFIDEFFGWKEKENEN